MANETKIVITAATAQAESAMRSLGTSVEGIGKKIMSFGGIAAGLGGALSITAFAGFIKSSIDAADRLDELSQITGTSVEALAGLDYAAKQNGASLETVARGGQKLSAILSDKPELFKKLGISATDSTEAMIQLADIFATMPDGMEKSALAAKLFGDRLGGEMILFLNQGTAAMRANIAAGQEYNPVTAESTRLAAEFNDNLDKLRASAGQAGMAMTNDLLPPFTKISDAMAQAAREGGLFEAAMIGIGGVFVELFKDSDVQKIASLKREIQGINEYLNNPGMFTKFSELVGGQPFDNARKMLEQRKAELASLEAAQAQEKQVKPPEKPADSGKGKSLLGALGGDGKAKKEKPFDPEGDFWFAVDEAAMKNQQKRNEQYLKDLTKSEEETNQQLQRSALEAQAIIFDIDPIAKVSAEWEKLTALKEQGLLTDEQIGKSYAKTFKDIGKDGSDAFKSLESAARGWGNEFTDILATGKDGFSGLIDSMFLDMKRMYIQQNITDPLMTAGTGFLGKLFGGMFGGGSSASSGATAASWSSTSMPMLPSFAVGTDYVPRDMIAQIHKGERIVPAAFNPANGGGAAAPSVTLNIINAPTGTQVQQRPDGNGGMTLDVIIEQIEGGIARNVSRGTGALNGALTQTFGLNRTAGAMR